MVKRMKLIRNMRNIVRKYPNFADMRAALTAAYWEQGKKGEAESNWVAAVGLGQALQRFRLGSKSAPLANKNGCSFRKVSKITVIAKSRRV